jgi:AcrR family transcriptional regulator
MAEGQDSERKRNRGFEETHRLLIEAAVRLISEKGAEALSVSELARAAGLNRTTVYYHFPGRDAMLAAVREWSAHELAKGMQIDVPQEHRAEQVTRFVLENPELAKLWFDDFIAPGDVRERYSAWDELVSGLGRAFAADEAAGGEGGDAEVYAVMLLTAAIIGPRVFRNSVQPGQSDDEIAARFLAEHRRRLKRDKLLG